MASRRCVTPNGWRALRVGMSPIRDSARLSQGTTTRGRWLRSGTEGFLRLGGGRWQGEVMAPMAVRVAQVQVQPRALSATDIAALWTSGLAAP